VKILLSNNFHDTETYIRPCPLGNGYYGISRRSAKRAQASLCGIEGCACGDTFGARGGHYVEIVNQAWEGDYIVRLPSLVED